MNSKNIALIAAIIAIAAAVAVVVPSDDVDGADALAITDVTFDDETVPGMVFTNVYLNKTVENVTAFQIVSADGTILSSSLPGTTPSETGTILGTVLTSVPADGYTITVTADNETAKWPATVGPEPTTYTVTFMVDGAEYDVLTVEENGTIVVPEVPVKEGFTFQYWSLSENGTEYDITAPVTENITLYAVYKENAVDPEPEMYIITWQNYDGSVLDTTEVAEGEMPEYTGATPVREADAEYTYTFAGWEPAIVAAAADATYKATFTATPVEPVDPEEDPAERPFSNTITLGDGAVIDASSSINASYTQEVVIAGDVTVAADGYLDIKGKLTIQADAVLTIEEGGNVIIRENGIVDVQGDLYAEAGTAAEATFQYGGCLMTVAGTVTLEGADSFETTDTAADIQISGVFEVGDEATAVLNETTVAAGGQLYVYGVVKGTVANDGTVTIDSQGLAGGDKVDMTVQLKAAGAVEVTNVYGTVVVTDSELTFTEKKQQVDVDNTNTVTLENVTGVTVTENLVIEKNEEDEKNHGINTMLVAGGITVADDYNSTENLNGKVTVAGDKVEVAEAVTLGEGVTLSVAGDLTVSGEATAIDGAIDGNGTITVTGKVTTADKGVADTVKFNAALYQTERVGTSPVYDVYTTLETALTDGATAIDLLGKNAIEGAATIPVGTTVEMEDRSELTIGKDASLTVASDDRKSGKLNTAAGAVNKIVVDGTMDVQNFAKSGIKADAVLSDTSKQVEDAMSFTNVYNALANAADGETVKVTRGIPLTLEENVEIRSGVTLLIPAGETVNVDHGVTVTVDGTLVNQGTYAIADEVEDVEATPENEYKAAGATIVNGMMLYSNGAYTDDIVGAYFEYTYEKKPIDAIAPLASLPAIAGDIGSDIYLYGQMALGAIDFSAYDGEGALETIYAANDLTVESLTLGDYVAFDAATAGAVVDGTIVLTNGTVVLTNVNGIVAKNTVDEVEDTVTSEISGSVVAVQDEDVDGEEKAVVSITGEVSSAMTTAALVTFDVPAGATATMTAGNLSDVTVEGAMVIAQNGVVFDSLAVTGTVSAEENFSATAKKLFVGVTADDLAMAGAGDVSGVVIGTAADSVAYVSPNATIAEGIVKNLKATAYYVDDALYVTAYANQTNSVKVDIDFSVENAFFDAWQYENADGKMVDVSANDMVGSPIEEVHAKIVYEIYGVIVTADAGIGTVAIDGNVLVNSGNQFILNTLLAAGQHTISYTLKSGYQGEAVLTVNGEGATVSGLNFTLAGNPSEDATGEGMDYVVEVNLSLSGTEPGQTTVVVDNGGESGMGLTDYLLIILVVLIVVMAIIVALRMMRS